MYVCVCMWGCTVNVRDINPFGRLFRTIKGTAIYCRPFRIWIEITSFLRRARYPSSLRPLHDSCIMRYTLSVISFRFYFHFSEIGIYPSFLIKLLIVFSAVTFPSNWILTRFSQAPHHRVRVLSRYYIVRVFTAKWAWFHATGAAAIIFICRMTPENVSFDRMVLFIFSRRDARSYPRVAARASASNCFDGCSDSIRLNKTHKAASFPG